MSFNNLNELFRVFFYIQSLTWLQLCYNEQVLLFICPYYNRNRLQIPIPFENHFSLIYFINKNYNNLKQNFFFLYFQAA